MAVNDRPMSRRRKRKERKGPEFVDVILLASARFPPPQRSQRGPRKVRQGYPGPAQVEGTVYSALRRLRASVHRRSGVFLDGVGFRLEITH